MILKVKHRAAYYRRFQLDIWGLLRTTVFYKASPVEPASEDWQRYYTPRPLSQKKREIPLVQEHLMDDLRPTSFQGTLVPWAYASRRLSRLLDFFYKAQEQRRKAQRERRRRFVYEVPLSNRYTPRRALKERFVSLRLVKLYYVSYSYRQFRRLARDLRRRQGSFEENYLMALESRVASLIYRMTFLGNPFHCLEFVRLGHVFIQGHCQRKPNYTVPLHQMVTFSELGRRWIYQDLAYRLGRHRLLFNAPSYVVISLPFLYGYQRRPPLSQDLVFPIAVDFYRASGYAF